MALTAIQAAPRGDVHAQLVDGSQAVDATLESTLSPSDDLGTALMELIAANRAVLSATTADEIDRQQVRLERARKEFDAAMARTKDAQEGAGFWGGLADFLGGDVAMIAGLVASIAATVLSFGAAAPVAVLLAASTLASATASIGARLGLDPKLCLALAGAGALAGLAVGRVDQGVGFWNSVKTGAELAQGAAAAGGGAATVAKGVYDKQVIESQADVTQQQGIQDDAGFAIDLGMDELGRAAREYQRARGTVSEIQRIDSDARLDVVARIGVA